MSNSPRASSSRSGPRNQRGDNARSDGPLAPVLLQLVRMDIQRLSRMTLATCLAMLACAGHLHAQDKTTTAAVAPPTVDPAAASGTLKRIRDTATTWLSRVEIDVALVPQRAAMLGGDETDPSYGFRRSDLPVRTELQVCRG